MQTYPALAIMVRHGAAIAAAGALCVLVLCLWVGLAGAGAAFWLVFAVVAACAAGFLLLVMHDIVRIIADTLIPAP